MLRRLLDSIKTIDPPEDCRLQLRIVDNDADESAKDIVKSIQSNPQPFEHVSYLVESQQNIALARNKAIDAGEADLVVFVDDDEVVQPEWLTQLLNAIDRNNADAAFGPVDGRLDGSAPKWMHRSKLFYHDVASNNGLLTWQNTRTGNTIVKGNWLYQHHLRFKECYGRSGGSDTELFTRIWLQGGRFNAADNAIVWENVPPERATFRWLFNRRFRGGLVYHRICTDNNIKYIPLLQFGWRIVKAITLIVKGLPACLAGRVETCMLGLLTLPLAWGGLVAWLCPKYTCQFAEYQTNRQSGNQQQPPTTKHAA